MTSGRHPARQEERPPTTEGPVRKALDNPWLILGFLFFAAAVFGLPALWASRAFSRPVKILLSAVVLLYTVLILWLFWLVMSWCWGRIMESLGSL